MIPLLIKLGTGDRDYEGVTTLRRASQDTALHHAATKKQPNSVTLLLRHAADVRIKSLFSETPLQCAKKANNKWIDGDFLNRN